jgi:hypothetical protein
MRARAVFCSLVLKAAAARRSRCLRPGRVFPARMLPAYDKAGRERRFTVIR